MARWRSAALVGAALLAACLPGWADSRPTAEELRNAASWAAAVFSGTAETAPGPDRLARALPFSFVYGGRHSAALLPGWTRTQTTARLDSRRTRHTLGLSDPVTGLAVVCEAICYSDYPAIDYVLRFGNTGAKDTPELTGILPLDLRVRLNPRETPRVHYSRGGGNSPEDYRLFHAELEKGKPFSLAAAGGRSSNTHMPWFNLQWDGGGLIAAIGWSGQWKADVVRGDGLELRAGMEDAGFVLHPGETVRTPRIVLVPWAGGDLFRSYNINRHLMLDRYMPRVNGEPVFPPISKNTAYDELELSPWKSNHGLKNQLDIVEAARSLGIEHYWLDAYWFKDYFPTGVGNWRFPVGDSVRESFPGGLKPLADAVHKAGMKFILWFEPERVHPGTYIDREKRAWTLRLPGSEQSLFHLAGGEASRWITEYVIESLKTFDVDVCRIDFNIDPLPYWRQADALGRKGMTEIGHIQNLYRMWDEILASKPGIWIDNCASGGRRIDIETSARSLPLWRSDFNDTPRRRTEEIGAIADQVMTMGLSLYVPLHSGPVWRPEPYYWRSAMSAGNAVYWDIRPDKTTGRYDFDRDMLRQGIAELKALRPYYLGDYYPLTDLGPDPKAWAAYQYIRPRPRRRLRGFLPPAGIALPRHGGGVARTQSRRVLPGDLVLGLPRRQKGSDEGPGSGADSSGDQRQTRIVAAPLRAGRSGQAPGFRTRPDSRAPRRMGEPGGKSAVTVRTKPPQDCDQPFISCPPAQRRRKGNHAPGSPFLVVSGRSTVRSRVSLRSPVLSTLRAAFLGAPQQRQQALALRGPEVSASNSRSGGREIIRGKGIGARLDPFEVATQRRAGCGNRADRETIAVADRDGDRSRPFREENRGSAAGKSADLYGPERFAT